MIRVTVEKNFHSGLSRDGEARQSLSREDWVGWVGQLLATEGLVGIDEGSRELTQSLLDEGVVSDPRDWTQQESLLQATFFFKEQAEAQRACQILLEVDPEVFCGVPEEEPEQDWSQRWREFFLSQASGWEVPPFWKIVPEGSGLEKKQREGLLTLHLCPGAGFGTGTHETTQLCLEAIGHFFLQHPQAWKGQYFLDFGTGSGILAIACALLGARVLAVDCDPLALENAQHNARLNGVASQIEWLQLDSAALLENTARGFDGVIANILKPVLLQQGPSLLRQVRSGGFLCLSGLLGGASAEDQVVLKAYQALAHSLGSTLTQVQAHEKNEWRSLQMVCQHSSLSTVPLEKTYEPQKFEALLYTEWEQAGCFQAQAENQSGQASFCMMIPPPNVTGALHIGHALTNTLQDTLVRWQRMLGKNVLWQPGTDHAGISTQIQVEKYLAQQGPEGKKLSRHDLGREKFLEKVWEWKKQYGSRITEQLRALGSSLDWKRERFTLDDGFRLAVRKVFIKLYEEGLLYRGERLIHWCVRCQTALSDLEVCPTERQGNLWSIRYLRLGASDVADSLVVSTTRPETLLGDVALAVHPQDSRYQKWLGARVRVPLGDRDIPVIADESVDPLFGTGVLKVTPGHDFHDAEIGKRHGLSALSVFSPQGRVVSEFAAYAGLTISEARSAVVQDLEEAGWLVGQESRLQSIGVCDRCRSVVEPLLSEQWFLNMQPLAAPAIEAVRQGRIQFFPAHWEKTYFDWMLNLRDWCVSRQLWWGHPIPAWHCRQCRGVLVAEEKPAQCAHCQAVESFLQPDPDVLDTWFSSALWPFVTLGWPEKTAFLKTFYPNSILETGFDILFFWVARMIMMGIHLMGEVPFQRVYLHGLVRDEKGEKMSKTKGNVIDPLDVMAKYGTDALRFTLLVLAGQGREIKLSLDRVEGYRAFCNKFWNAVQFYHFHRKNAGKQLSEKERTAWLNQRKAQLGVPHRWILGRLHLTIEKVTQGLEQFALSEAAQSLYRFIWNELCDWYLEIIKPPLAAGGEAREEALWVLEEVLDQTLRLAHPFLPFMTERLWGSLKPSSIGFLMQQAYPVTFFPPQPEVENILEDLQKWVEAVRQFRGEHQLSSKDILSLRLPPTLGNSPFWNTWGETIKVLARVSLSDDRDPQDKSQWAPLTFLERDWEAWMKIPQQVTPEEEKRRLEKEWKKIQEELEWVQKKLGQASFLEKAPPALVEKEQGRARELLQKVHQLEASLKKWVAGET